jgi:hypothetical protein
MVSAILRETVCFYLRSVFLIRQILVVWRINQLQHGQFGGAFSEAAASLPSILLYFLINVADMSYFQFLDVALLFHD